MWSNKQGQAVGQTQTFWFPECWLMKTRTPFSAMVWTTIKEMSELGMQTIKEMSELGMQTSKEMRRHTEATSYLEPVLPQTVLWKQNWVAAAASLSCCRNCVGLTEGVRCVAPKIRPSEHLPFSVFLTRFYRSHDFVSVLLWFEYISLFL